MSSILEPTSPLSGTSTYFTISEPKARFLTRYSQDMNQCHIVKDTKDLTIKKVKSLLRLFRIDLLLLNRPSGRISKSSRPQTGSFTFRTISRIGRM
jgi:hypothetical protein